MAEKKTPVTLGNQSTAYPRYGVEGANRLGRAQRVAQETKDEIAAKHEREAAAGRRAAAARVSRGGPAYSKRRG